MLKQKKKNISIIKNDYSTLISDISAALETARKFSARSVNAILTSAYWLIGKRIVEYEYQGMDRSEYYGDKLLVNISSDLQKKFGRGFSRQNIQLMKQFYEVYPLEKTSQTLSGKSQIVNNISQTPSDKSIQNIPQTPSSISVMPSRNFDLNLLIDAFPLPWSHYVRLLSVKDDQARKFYESEALRNGLKKTQELLVGRLK